MTYEEVAEKFGVELCQRSFGRDDADHESGSASFLPPTVHWRERRMNVIGLRRFLMLVALARWPERYVGPRWAEAYRVNKTAVELSRILGRRLDQRHLSAADRERTRYLLARVNQRHLTPDEKREFALVRKWVNRWPPEAR